MGRDCLCRRAAPRIGPFVLPVCWRCSGMFLGLFIAVVTMAACGNMMIHDRFGLLAATVLCACPAALDVAAQVLSAYRSNSARRLATGLLLGIAIGLARRLLTVTLEG